MDTEKPLNGRGASKTAFCCLRARLPGGAYHDAGGDDDALIAAMEVLSDAVGDRGAPSACGPSTATRPAKVPLGEPVGAHPLGCETRVVC